MSRSGKTTRWAPHTLEDLPVRRGDRLGDDPRDLELDAGSAVVRMLASISVPMATIAVSRSLTPSWRIVSMSVVVGLDNWVRRLGMILAGFRVRVDAEDVAAEGIELCGEPSAETAKPRTRNSGLPHQRGPRLRGAEPSSRSRTRVRRQG